mmetsp:Transcript_4351/g.11051  ORF Transcript_4351/g.11051 Transcript_4351/m.11051 type:complete len:206 (-) Transcript_4351:492-1109(-)
MLVVRDDKERGLPLGPLPQRFVDILHEAFPLADRSRGVLVVGEPKGGVGRPILRRGDAGLDERVTWERAAGGVGVKGVHLGQAWLGHVPTKVIHEDGPRKAILVIHLPCLATLLKLAEDRLLREARLGDLVVSLAVRRPRVHKLSVRVCRPRVRAEEAIKVGKLLCESGDDRHFLRRPHGHFVVAVPFLPHRRLGEPGHRRRPAG